MALRNYRPALRIAVTLPVAVLLVLLLGSLRPGALSSRTGRDIFWTQKVFGRERYNIIFTGDSRVYRGISTREVENAVDPDGVKAFNFGFSSGGQNAEVFEAVNKRLDTSGIRCVVLGLSPFSLTPKAQENGHYQKLLTTKQEEVFLNLHVQPHLLWFDPIEPEEAYKWFISDSTGYYEQFIPGGWVASLQYPMQPLHAVGVYRQEFTGNQVKPSTVDSVLLQTHKWVAEGVQVFAFTPPTCREMEAVEDSLSGLDRTGFRARLEAAGGVWLETGPLSDYVSYDGSHITRSSAILLSRRLGEGIRKHLEHTGDR